MDQERRGKIRQPGITLLAQSAWCSANHLQRSLWFKRPMTASGAMARQVPIGQPEWLGGSVGRPERCAMSRVSEFEQRLGASTLLLCAAAVGPAMLASENSIAGVLWRSSSQARPTSVTKCSEGAIAVRGKAGLKRTSSRVAYGQSASRGAFDHDDGVRVRQGPHRGVQEDRRAPPKVSGTVIVVFFCLLCLLCAIRTTLVAAPIAPLHAVLT